MLLIAVNMNGKWYGRCDGNPDVADVAEDLDTFLNEGNTVILKRDEDAESVDEAFEVIEADLGISIIR